MRLPSRGTEQRRRDDAVDRGADGVVDQLTGFVDALRDRGIEVGPSALIDAAAATGVLDLLDRTSFREGLACTLLSEQMHRAAFDATFDLWFPAGTGARTGATDLPTDDDGSPDVEQIRQMVADMLADGDAENDGRLADLVSAIVDRIGRYESTRGEAFSTYQAMSTIRPQTLIARIAAAMAAGSGDDDGGTQARYRRSAAARVDRLGELVSEETRRRMVERSGRDRVAEYAVPTLPEDIAFLSAGRSEILELRKTIDPLARLLAAKLEIRRRRARRGVVDVRKTLRASMSTGGVPIDLIYRKPRPGRPELVILCDVSGSVSGFSQFTLQLVAALRQHFSAVRVFAFVDTVDEVTEYFARSADTDVHLGSVIHEMLSRARLITRDGHSDYGHALEGFVADHADSLTHRGALLVLGDGRTNYHDPRFGALRTLVDRARHAYWLNPESRELWDSGDSMAADYARIIEMHECRNARQLAEVIGGLLPV